MKKKLSKESDRLKARVSMPKLLALQASGAAHVSAHGQLNVGDEQIRIQLSGASELDDLKASGRQVFIQLSGASKGEVEGAFPEKVLLDLSGASKLRYKGNTDKLLIECSGASSLDAEGDAGQLTANVSGSSKCEIAGKANDLTMEGSGASYGTPRPARRHLLCHPPERAESGRGPQDQGCDPQGVRELDDEERHLLRGSSQHLQLRLEDPAGGSQQVDGREHVPLLSAR